MSRKIVNTKFFQTSSLWTSCLIATVAGLAAIKSYSAGFQLSEQSVTGLGHAFAGSGVTRNDASVLFYNPAGMSLVRGQRLQGNLNGVFLDTDFRDDGNSTGLGVSGEADSSTLVPNLFYVSEGRQRLKWGMSVSTPFGLKTQYANDWVGRYHAIDSEFAAINFSPAVSYRINDQWSIGAGIDIQYADALLSRANPPVVAPQGPDSYVEIEGDSWDYGYNAGVVYQPNPNWRLGLSFRSKVEHTIEGEADVSNSNVGLNGSYSAETEITLPETAYFSAAYDINDQWTVMSTARWTKWERFDVLNIEIQDLPDEVVPERWENTWMYSLGATYRLSRDITFRAGIAQDHSPVPSDNLRTPRIPDSDRDWITAGVSFNHFPRTKIDLGVAYLRADKVGIDNTVALSSAVRPTDRLSGNVDASVTIVGAQWQYQF